jgi:transposase
LKYGARIFGREIVRRLSLSASTVRETLKRAAAAGISWPLSPDLTDTVLEDRLYGQVGSRQGHRRIVHRELKRKHVTLSILWDEYIAHNPDGFRYSRFCELYRAWEGKRSVTMRQSHAGGEKLFVDYAGDTVPVIIDRLTGEMREDLRRGDGRLELHLRPGELDANVR